MLKCARVLLLNTCYLQDTSILNSLLIPKAKESRGSKYLLPAGEQRLRGIRATASFSPGSCRHQIGVFFVTLGTTEATTLVHYGM